IFVERSPANGRFLSACTALYAIHNPFQNAEVVTKAGPQELALGVLAEPVHVENPWSYGERALHLDPMPEIVPHVIAAKGKHRHGIAAYFTNLSRCRGSRF